MSALYHVFVNAPTSTGLKIFGKYKTSIEAQVASDHAMNLGYTRCIIAKVFPDDRFEVIGGCHAAPRYK